MEPLTYTFVTNIFLTFIDATIGYYAAPALAALVRSDEEGGAEGGDGAVRGMRRLLSFVVALYAFFNCLAYFDRISWLSYFISGVLAVDITAQLVIYRKMTSRRGR